ncbi:MAG: hypothetical protein QXP36_12125 [Conexivisphaerales archaeon]
MDRRSRKVKSEVKEEEREKVIREGVRRGYSANQIQRELQKRGLGMRRKRLLAVVRRVKGVRKKPHAEKYVPKWILARGKRVAVYGTVEGQSRRAEIYGKGRSLYQVMQVAVKHPPKKRFLKETANRVLASPKDYFDIRAVWDERPEIES